MNSSKGIGRLGWAITLGTLIPACHLSELPSQQQNVAGALPEGTVVPRQWASQTSAGKVTKGWLKSFRDPRLNSLVAEAISYNPDLRQAAARVEVARENVTVINSQLLPQVGGSVSGAAIQDEDSGSAQSRGATVFVAWEPDVWGRIRSQRSAAEQSFNSSALDFAYARQSLAATVAKSWYTAVETRRLVDVAEEGVTVYTDLLRLVKIQRESGKVTDLNVVEASADLKAAKGQLKVAQGLYSESRRNLEKLLGRYPAAEIEVARTFTPIPPPVQADIPSALIARRPDLVAAECDVLAALRAEESARLALLPSFFLDVTGGRLSDGLLDLLRLNPWLLRSSIGMNVPIYQGGRLEAEIRIANAQQQQALAAYGSAILNAFEEVENALTNESLIDERLQLEKEELQDRTDAVRIARVQYEAGSIDLLSVLQLQASQLASQTALVKLQNLQLANRINLHLALGGDFRG
ncbi:efflux transporter outer membrane subunit [Haloferula sp.]|uniref:efflux transporter outer membrane subunit n=1 Tax=Haloferula sp. TaxID=2497595 RepID=UPI003C76973A